MFFDSRTLSFVAPIVSDTHVKWDENTDVSTLSKENRNKYQAAFCQRQKRQNKLTDSNEKE